MRVDFECAGGYANLRLAYHADTEELPPGLGEEITALVRESGFFELVGGDATPPGPGAADAISYRLTVGDGATTKSVSVTDVTAPASLRALLGRLMELALEQRRQ